MANKHMSEQLNVSVSGAKKAIIEVLSQRSKKARFITEVVASLRRYNVGKDELEQALVELEAAGAIIIRDHFCADPHLAGVDLRVVALLDDAHGADAQMAALHEIDLAWNKWLGEYLANHRCG